MERKSILVRKSGLLRALASLGGLATLYALFGCAGRIVPTMRPSPNQALDVAPMSLAQEMVKAVSLDPTAVIIGEDTYTALLARRGKASPLPARHRAAPLAANLADPTALGVTATLQRGPTRIRSNFFIVLRDPALSPNGELEGRDAFVVAVELSGVVPWFGRSSRLALVSDVSGVGYRNVPRGCRPVFDTRSRGAEPFRFSSSRPDEAGLPSTVLLNLESGAGPPNASGHRPRLLVFGANRTQSPSAYECHAPVGWDSRSDELHAADGEGAKPAQTAALPSAAILLSERDFLTALSQGKSAPAVEQDVPATRRLLTLANSAEALGISALYDEAKSFSGELFVVARNPAMTPDGRVTAMETSTREACAPAVIHSARASPRHARSLARPAASYTMAATSS